MANWYYYDNNGQKRGPITSAQLQTLVINKIVIPTTRIVTEDGRETAAGAINGLFTTPPPVVAPVSDTSTKIVTQSTMIWGSGMDSNILFMFMHLCGLFFFPMMIFLWVVAKDSERANVHGKIILNWYLSAATHMVGLVLVIFIVVVLTSISFAVTGSSLIFGIALAILAPCPFIFVILITIFPIIAAVKAANGKIWKYPFSLSFFFRVNVPKN
ncbi:MAG: DUF4870 domain-containing protein [Planctomycetaceae bacterium]|jgi:uncharacterized Tic20 family protein|nr:DUF4870 domain-containing protein [Planctomycetaceae bacterium]